MLKLTHSFCRYSHLTRENIQLNRVIIRKFTQLSRSKTCGILSVQSVNPFVWAGVRGRLVANIKKRLRELRPEPKVGVARTHKQMSEPLQPTLQHASFGGQFEV